MIKFAISKENLIYIFKALKPAVAKNGSKPVLQYIQFNCADGELTCYAVDGYRIHTVTVQIDVESDDKIFSFLLRPFTVPKTPADYISCVLDSDEITFDFWDRKLIEKLGKGEFIDCAKAFPTAAPIFKIAFNPSILIDALKSFPQGGDYGKVPVILEFTHPLSACVIRRHNNKTDSRLVLPLRT